jgi:hypothetical protein
MREQLSELCALKRLAGSGREDTLQKVSRGAHRGAEFFDCGLSGEQE